MASQSKPARGKPGLLRRCLAWVLTAVLCVSILSGVSCGRGATAAPVNLRVAYYPLDGFFEYDENGNEVGYGVDLLNLIAQYTGIHFTYVPADSWESTKNMLLEGEADLRLPATAPSTPSTVLGYSNNSIMTNCRAIMTLDSRDDLYYQDYQVFKTLKIGITESMFRTLSTDSTFESYGFTDENFVYFDTYDEEYIALQSGQVDAVVSNIMDLSDGMKLLERFSSVPSYITMTIDNPYLDILDDALTQINMEDPAYLSDLYREWFPDRNNTPLTREEAEYIQSLGSLCFSFRDGQGYLSRRDEDGSFTGFYPQLGRRICETLGVEYQGIGAADGNADGIVLYPDCYYDFEWANENEFEISQPYLTVRYYQVSNRSATLDHDTCKVAAVQGFRVTRDFIASGYSQDQMVWCTNYAECIKAVADGKADLTYVNNYTAEYYLFLYRYANLTYTLTSYTHKACIAVSGDETGLLTSILNKALTSISPDELNTMLIASTADRPEQDALQEWFISSPVRAAAVIAGGAALLIAILIVSVFAVKLRKKNRTLAVATAAKSDFLSRMSHDIRTPLNVIIGMSRMAKENDNPPDTQLCLDKVGIASDFLLGLINDVLDMQKVESGKIQLHLEPYSASEFEKYIDAVIRPLCEQKNIRFTFSCDADDTFVVLKDKLRINQVYFNLLSNAVKFTPEGGSVSLTIHARPLGEHRAALSAVISDTGIGMSREFQAHMFESFVQENQVLTPVSNGSGLGLAIVKKMCELMGMTISVESALGKGTTYTLRGEYDLAAPEQLKKVSAAPEAADSSVLRGKHILVCEDHPMNQEIVRRMLEKQGMLVDFADDGRRGVAQFARSAPGNYAAILMDIRMPVLNGLDAARQIRGLDRPDAKSVPIIAMTANAYEEDVEKSLNAGMNAHLSKPLDPETLCATIARFISSAAV